MSKDENTAINELLARASAGARTGAQATDPDADLHNGVTIPLPRRAGARPADPAARRSAPAELAPLTLPPEHDDGGWGAPPRRRRASWRPHDERNLGTLIVRADRRPPRGKLVLAMSLFALVGIGVGTTIAFRGRSLPSDEAPAGAAPPASQPVASSGQPAAPAAAAAPAPAAELVDVRIDSTPSGATVMLVDRGKTQFVGTTPIRTSVDPSREYDVVLTYPDLPTRAVHFDARTTRRIDLALDPRAPAARADEPAADPAPRRAERAAPRSAPRTAELPPRAEPAEVGEGTLMISSKPPCEILIDGKPTGLMTPQRSITLSAGRHKVTLVNAEKAIEKTLTVQVTAGGTEKIIEDLMAN